MAIQVKRALEDVRKNSTTVLREGQPLYTTDNKMLYIGEEDTPVNELKGTQIGLNIKNGEQFNTPVTTKEHDDYPVGTQFPSNSIVSTEFKYVKDVGTEDETIVTATATADGIGSIAWGINADASGKTSFAFGHNVVASGNTSMSFGQDLENSKPGAFLTGQGHVANRAYQTIVGKFADYKGNADKLFQVGNGSTSETCHDAFAVVSGGWYVDDATGNKGYAIAASTPDTRNDALTRVDWVKNYVSAKCAPHKSNDTYESCILINTKNVYTSKVITSSATASTAVLRDGNGFIKVGDIEDALITNSAWQDVCTNLKFVRGYTYTKAQTDSKDATTLSNAKSYTDALINALDYSASGASNKTITSLSQINGKIAASFTNISYPVTSVCDKTGAVKLDKSDVGLDKVDNTSDAEKKTAFTGRIESGNTGFVTGGSVYSWFGSLHDIQFEDCKVTAPGAYPTVEFYEISSANVYMLTISKIETNKALTATTYMIANPDKNYSQTLTLDNITYTITRSEIGVNSTMKITSNNKDSSFAACLIHMY